MLVYTVYITRQVIISKNMTHNNLIKTGFNSQYRKERRAAKRQELYTKIMLLVLGAVLVYFFYAMDVIINRAIDLM